VQKLAGHSDVRLTTQPFAHVQAEALRRAAGVLDGIRDAGMLFEETNRTLFASDLFLHGGEVEPLVDTDIVGRARNAMIDFQSTQLLNSISYSSTTKRQMAKLAALQPRTLAIMHGSSFAGDGGNAIRNLASAMKEVLGKE
jgi:hypothetical protein